MSKFRDFTGMGSLHPALAPFDQETRQRAWDLLKTRDGNRVEVDGELLLCCPLGVCIFALTGNKEDLFPWSSEGAKATLSDAGYDDIAAQIRQSEVMKLFDNYLYWDTIPAAVFGVDE